MINGLFLDPRSWKIDYLSSPYWNPKKYGVNIDLHPNAFRIPQMGIDKKYKFVIATEVWEIPIHKTLDYLRKKGLKVFLVPREIAPPVMMFNEEKFKHNGKCFFMPDKLLSAGERYASLWRNVNIEKESIGHPRFDIYLKPNLWKTRKQILKRFGIEPDKKIIFFPSFPPFALQTVNGKNEMADLQDDLQSIMRSLEQFALNNDGVQVIVKIHPYAQKCYNKKIGFGNEVSGLLKKYYKHPTKNIKVIGDIRNDSSVSREMIIIADIVTGYTSMMLLEAAIINKPIVHIEFVQARKLLSSIPEFNKHLYTVQTPDSLGVALKDVMLNKTNQKYMADPNIIEYYLHKIDGKFCERLCANIKKYK